MKEDVQIFTDKVYEEAQAKQAKDNGGHPGQIVDGGADDARDGRGVGSVFGQVNGGDDPDRQNEQGHDKNACGRADDHGQYPGGFAIEEILLGDGRDKMPRQGAPAVVNHIRQDGGKNGQDQDRGQSR